MPAILGRKISLLSKGLKILCCLGIALFPFLNFIYWMLDIPGIRFLTIENWYIQFSDMPSILSGKLSVRMRLLGFGIDLFPCAFFVAILFYLSRLFKQYERLHFFSKKNAHYIRMIALILFGYVVTYPFYSVLRSYAFTPPGHDYTVVLFGPNGFKVVVISFAILLFAYITESAHRLEEDMVGIV